MALHIKKEDLREYRVELAPDQGSGTMAVTKVHGREASLMTARRVPGYHTRPHKHDSEQINYIVSGEIWFFIEDRAFHCQAGDFMRIPRNRIHWAWNRSDQETVVIECHSPALSSGPGKDLNILMDEGESRETYNVFIEYDSEATERRMDEIAE